MFLTVLCDNNTFIDNYLLGEPALSFYIENGSDKILFDTGYSDVYVKNAKTMGIDLSKVNKIVLSHGHDDHTKGLKYNKFDKRVKMYCCEGCFEKKFCDNVDISSPFSKEKISTLFDLAELKEPTEISKNLYVLGKVPRLMSHEKPNPCLQVMKDGKKITDIVEEDTALVFDGADGLFVITGCSHSGICNICEWAKKCFKKPIKAVIGGFHLLEFNEQAKETIKYLKKQNIDNLYPCHCTGLYVKAEMIKQKLNVHDVGSGLKLKFK